jgi:lipocalin
MGSLFNRAAVKVPSVLFLILAAGFAHADVWVLSVEPSFTESKMRRPIEGSRRTVIAVSRLVDGEIEPLTREQKKSVHMTFDQIRGEALKTAKATLEKLEPRFFRDKNKVVTHAVLESEDPLTASCVLAPGFAERFRETLGPDLLVAMPSRNTVLVFSRQDVQHLRLAEAVIDAYLSSNYRVSREIFALENERLRSLGVLR